MRSVIRCSSFVLILALAGGHAVAGGEWAIEIGATRTVDSAVHGRTMNLVVRLPPGYETHSARYPVLYMIGSEFRARCALTASTLDYMSELAQIPPMILVGIDLPEGNGVLVPRGEGPHTSGARHAPSLPAR